MLIVACLFHYWIMTTSALTLLTTLGISWYVHRRLYKIRIKIIPWGHKIKGTIRCCSSGNYKINAQLESAGVELESVNMSIFDRDGYERFCIYRTYMNDDVTRSDDIEFPLKRGRFGITISADNMSPISTYLRTHIRPNGFRLTNNGFLLCIGTDGTIGKSREAFTVIPIRKFGVPWTWERKLYRALKYMVTTINRDIEKHENTRSQPAREGGE